MKPCCAARIPEPPAHPDWMYVWTRCVCGQTVTRYVWGYVAARLRR